MRSVRPSIAITISSTLLSLSLLGSCSPQGQWTPVLHLPHPLLRDQSEPNAANSEGALRGKTGWPAECQSPIESASGKFCLSCRYDPWLLQRCYDYSGEIFPKQQCIYNSEQVKCLVGQPLFALVLPLKRSQERVLFENYLAWESTVREIWEGRLEETERQSLRKLLHFTRDWAERLSQKDNTEVSDSELLASYMEPHTEASLITLRASLERLQSQRLAGRLSLISYLQEIAGLLSAMGASAQLQEYLNALSLEGLEEGI